MKVNQGLETAAEILVRLNEGLEEVVNMGDTMYSNKTPEEQASIPGKELRARVDFVKTARGHLHAAIFNIQSANQRPSDTNKEVKN